MAIIYPVVDWVMAEVIPTDSNQRCQPHKHLAIYDQFQCKVCGQLWRDAPRPSCPGLPVYISYGDQPSDLLTSSELSWLGLPRPNVRAGVLGSGSDERDLFSVVAAVPEANPQERRRIAVTTRSIRFCLACLLLSPERANRQAPSLCSWCGPSGPKPFDLAELWLPPKPNFKLDDFTGLFEILQLAELEAKAVLEQAEADRAADELCAHQATYAHDYDMDLLFPSGPWRAEELVFAIRTWREEHSLPDLEAVDGEVVLRALEQALARLDKSDEESQYPPKWVWMSTWRDYVRWLHHVCAQFYAHRGLKNAEQIEVARLELRERLALLWWYERASDHTAKDWLVVPRNGWAMKEVSSFGSDSAQA